MTRQLIGALILIVAVAIMGQLGCRSCPKPIPPVTPAPLPEIAVITEEQPVLDTPRPVAPTYTAVGPQGGVPAPWAVCLKRDDAAILKKYLGDLETWADAAWARAGRKPPPTEATP